MYQTFFTGIITSTAKFPIFGFINKAFNNRELAGQTNQLLVVDRVGPESLGTYSVRVSNDIGTVTSRGAELTFANGAVHRIHFALKGKNDMRVRAFSGIPGAPLQKFVLELKRSKREAL